MTHKITTAWVVGACLLIPSVAFAYPYQDEQMKQQEEMLKGPVTEYANCLKHEASIHHYPVHDEWSEMQQRDLLLRQCSKLFYPAMAACTKSASLGMIGGDGEAIVEYCNSALQGPNGLAGKILEASQ